MKAVLATPQLGVLPEPFCGFTLRHREGQELVHLVDTKRDPWENTALCGVQPEHDCAVWEMELRICGRCARAAKERAR